MRKILYVIITLAVVMLGVFFVKENGKNVSLHTNRKVDLKQFEYVNKDDNTDGIVRIYKNGKWGVADKDGNLIADVNYDTVDNFYEGRAIVSENGKYGFIDLDSNIIVKPKYMFAYPFVNGYAVIQGENEKYGAIDKQGNLVIEPLYYDYISSFDINGYAKAMNFADGKNVAIDINGEIIKDFNAKK